MHHGSVMVENNMPKGANFIVTIPIMRLSPNKLDDQDSIKQKGSTIIAPDIPNTMSEKKTILVVEDNDDFRKFIINCIEDFYTILEAENGQSALKMMDEHHVDIVISDIMMPIMDGNELCSKVKSNINTNHIPVIMLTAKSRDEDRLEGLEMGADTYIVKPFNLDILRRTIINLLHQRELLRNKFNGSESQENNLEKINVESPDNKLLNRIMSVINNNLSDPSLNVDMIAQEVGISRVHLHRKMKELTNQTPHDFIRNLRLKQAAHLLEQGYQNITEVMFACGFTNPASFSTMFKNLYGRSPREYMKN